MNHKLTVEQNHLSVADTVNFGSYYTNSGIVNIIYKMIKNNIPSAKNYKILDTSCGYGNFFLPNYINELSFIGADIDKKAIDIAKKNHPYALLFNHNSLHEVNRSAYNLNETDKIIIIGNPPYNDTTSIIKNNIKSSISDIDSDLKTRDLGMSFLLSYNKLNADFICVLHPLSYLIKKSNFNLLKDFKNNYKLIDSIIISSQEFSQTSKLTAFPIIIAFYKKDNIGMDYNFIQNYLFKTIDGKSFILKNFDTIGNYITKYPNKNLVDKNEVVAFFWTMRDINALKRSKTFVTEANYNTIYVTKDKLDYYCYVDIFKKYIKHIPYYFGNCDVMIKHDNFEKNKEIFKISSLELKEYDVKNDNIIDDYFKDLLGEHFIYS